MVVGGALYYEGFPTADVDLNDGGVWVTNKGAGLVGHLNYQSKTLDGGFTANSDGFDVLQDESSVFMENLDQGMLSPVDVAEMSRDAEQQLPGSAEVSFGAEQLAITDKVKGQVFITPAAELGSFSEETAEPVLAGAKGSAAAVSPEDTVVVANPAANEIYTYRINAEGQPEQVGKDSAEDLGQAGDLQIAAVGDKAVVLDAESGTLFLPGGKSVDLGDVRGAKLQQSSAESGFAAVATETELITQPLNGSEADRTPLEAPGIPAAPVQLDGCLHAAWAGANHYIRDCELPADDLEQEIRGIGSNAELVFRVNRNVVVLNDVNAGNVWLVLENMQLVDNWSDLIPPEQESDEEDEDSADENPINTLPDRTEENRPPVAQDDLFGVRAGRTTTLAILDNDSDPDGDVLTASLSGSQPSVGEVQSIYDKTGLQIVVGPDASPGRHSFDYEVNDGRGGKDTARVTITVRAEGANEPPQAKRRTTILLEQGKEISQNILTDWKDPDGDDLFLVGAENTADGDLVRTRPDGLLTFQDVGKTYGKKKVAIRVSDGIETVDGEITVDVRPPGALAPVANADHFFTTAGQEIQVNPLKNDLDPNGGNLRLAKIEPVGNATATPDYDSGTVAFSSDTPGTYYLTYLVTNGPSSSTGLARIDVGATAADGAPVAVRDVALLPQNGQVLVDVLANDNDPAGGVLVVQGVESKEAAVSVEVVNHNILRITDVKGLNQQTTIKYTVSNGFASATGEVSIISVKGPDKLLPPQAENDTATVRAGDVVTVEVLANDTHPNGDNLELVPELAESVDEADGDIFTAGNAVRFIAGPTAKTVYAVYEVTDSAGQKDSAEIRINIIPRDDESNSQPAPKNLEARVIAGSTVRIPVPLNGIDPDGDSVFLQGIDRAPEQGAAVAGADYIDYTASAQGAGTDTFTYVVKDRLGAENTATVLVGIAPQAETNQNPIALDDGIVIRPGRTVAVDVLSNDSDPDGDPLALQGDMIAGEPASLDAAANKGRVQFTTPDEDGTVNVRYTVGDGRGGSAVGTVTAEVRADAPLLAPVARDDRVEPVETKGKTAVDVPVLDNDEDPDGVAEELDVLVNGDYPTASATAAGQVRVELTESVQLIPYTVRDAEGLQATAVIWVPALGEQYPLLADTSPVDVVAGEEVTIDLGDRVEVRDGRSPRITEVDKVRAIGTADREWVVDENTLRYAAAEDYAGRGSITFEVTDGSGPDDPEGLKSTLTVMTNVIPAPETNIPPEFTTGAVEVAKGEDAVSYDLRPLATDANPEDLEKLEFTLEGGAPQGFDVSLDGSVLQVSAEADVDTGASGVVNVSVTDGRSDKVTSRVAVSALASTRPLPVANDDEVPDAVQGEPVRVPVLANDVNPFPDTALEIVNATAGEGGTARVEGDAVVVTPNADFSGTMSVEYTVQDKTQEGSRQATGTVSLVVKGRPEAPTTPLVDSVRDETVVLSWGAPADNGDPITAYRVSGTGGFSQECATTTCTLTGLVNDREYTFTVVAVNGVGESDPSAESAVARPDVRPETPGAPRLKFGDKSLDVTWAPPVNNGSAIESYTLEISPAPPSGQLQKTGLTGTSYTWEGLENGQAYEVRVQAHNKAPEPSEFSPYSAAEVPAGPPAAAGAPTTERVQSVGDESQLRVSWAAPANNGGEILDYTVREYQGGSLNRTLPPVTGTSQTITAPNSEADYTYTVTARNKAGDGEASPQSNPRRAVGAPDAPTGVSLKEANTGGAGRSVTISFNELTAAQRNGARAGEVSYRAAFSDGRSMAVSSGQTVGGFTNGSNVTAQVTAVANSDGASYNSAPSARSNAAKPYGAPGTPSASGQGQSGETNNPQVTLSWAPPDTANHDVEKLQINIDGKGWENVAVRSGSRTLNVAHDSSHTIKVRAANSRGTYGAEASASARAGSKPKPKPPTEWKLTVGGSGTTLESRTCMEYRGSMGDNYDGPGDCDGNHWSYPGDSITSKCYIVSGSNRWYHQDAGSRGINNGLFIRGDHVRQSSGGGHLNGGAPAGMPRC
ncbi:fibronectin type III domain-containing protein [Arthrobacter crystallopoietes BAB-32]|uniref:Fibronectin type III domain-containing protein n=1 Tax=Arthrobacter crystallopoietes BAB-32 TaxID=1246476 RepID=N1US36_9MICC|nr:fibronectin type III domain-containing protein [Arthrobacter crystallopoietes BAB-32]